MISKTAETLTKQWLMGVRRGFLSILPKTVPDFDAALKTFIRLSNFVHRLELQVTKIRRGPNTDVDNDLFKPFSRDLGLLYSAINDAENSCKHWKSIHDGTHPFAGKNQYDKDAAANMLALYQTDFPASLSNHIPTKGRGPGGTRSADIVEIFDKMMKHLFDAAKALAKGDITETGKQYWSAEVPIEFKIGNMTFVVVYDFKSGRLFNEYVAEARAAYGKLKRWGLDKETWYGVTFIMDVTSNKLTDEEKAAYKRSGYDISAKAGDYNYASNDIHMWSRVDSFQNVLTHELGHRYWYKHMSQSQRMQFVRSVWTKDHDKVVRPPGDSNYVSKKEAENELRPKWEKLVSEYTAKWRSSSVKSSYGIRGWYDMFQRGIGSNPHVVWSYLMMVDQIFSRDLPKYGSDRVQITPLPEYQAYRHLYGEFEQLSKSDRPRLEALREKVHPGANGATAIDEAYRGELDAFVLENYQQYLKILEQIDGVGWQVIEAYLNAAYKTESDAEEVRNTRMVEPVSNYGKTNPSEAWAEAFSHLVSGGDMTVGQIRVMLNIIKGYKKQALKVAARFLGLMSKF